ncbi:MAG: hypothetical protein AAFZ18_08425 [Myxococcota bacterium]
MGSQVGETEDPKAVLIAARDLVASAVESALERVERVDAITKDAAAELAESLLAVESIAAEQRARLDQAAQVAREQADTLEETGGVEALRYALEEQVESSTAAVQAVEKRVSTAMRVLQFEDICTQILAGTLADLARLAEGFEAMVVVDDDRPLLERLEKLKVQLSESLSKVPDQKDLEAGASCLF